MPPALAPVTPEVLKLVLVRDGWEISKETSRHWELRRGGEEILLPNKGNVVAIEVMEHCLEKARISPGRLWELYREINFSHYQN